MWIDDLVKQFNTGVMSTMDTFVYNGVTIWRDEQQFLESNYEGIYYRYNDMILCPNDTNAIAKLEIALGVGYRDVKSSSKSCYFDYDYEYKLSMLESIIKSLLLSR